MRAKLDSSPTPTRDIIRQLEDTLNGGGLDHCHCHGPNCETEASKGGGVDWWDRVTRRSRAFASALARLHRLALRWGDCGGAPRQLDLPDLGLNSVETLAPSPGRGPQRYTTGRAGHGPMPPPKVGRGKQTVRKDRK